MMENNISALNESVYSLFNFIEYYASIIVLYSICPLLGVICNSFVIILCLNKNIVKESYKYFILNLSLADFILSLSLMFQNVHSFWYNDLLCKINAYLQSLSTGWMTMSLSLLPICRYVKLKNGKITPSIFLKEVLLYVLLYLLYPMSFLLQLH